MWLVSIRDLQWRRRRFIIGVLATSVLFAVTLILAGVNSNLRREATTTIEAVGADHWVVVEGTTGPVSGLSVMPMEVVDQLAAIQGVERAEPLVIIRQAIRVDGRELEEDVLLFASVPIMRPFGRMLSSFGLVSWLLWLAAAAVVGSIVFLTAIERTRDFAVLKAVGVGNASLFGGLALQAVLVSTAAALLSVVIARLLLPLFPTPMHITSGSIVLLVPVTVVVGLAASVASLRRVVMTDPARAFRGA